MRKEWELEEIQVLKTYYPIEGYQYVADMLNRSKDSVKHKARSLELKAPSNRWSVNQENMVRELYADFGAAYTANKVGKSIPAVQQKAIKLKVFSNYNQIKTTDQYIDDLESKGISYRPAEDYKGAHTPIKHSCSNGHIWETSTPSNILRFEAGCTKCRANYNLPNKLYYIKILRDNKVYYKVGITSKANWKRRFSSDLNYCDIKLLSLKEYPDRDTAYKAEQKLIESNKSFLTKDKPLIAGNTEVFDKDILGLDFSSTGPHLQHRHLVVTASVKNPPKNTEYIKLWLSNLITKLGMKQMMPIAAAYSDMIGNRGLTAVAVIETSNIALHVWDEESPAVFQLDVYSCSNVDPKIVWDAIEEFEPTTKEYNFLDRADGFVTVIKISS